jgi:hypothetical protein
MTVPVMIVATLTLVSGCATEAQRRAAESAEVQQQAVDEMKRVCALPEAEREAELERIRTQSGIVVECGKE